MRVLAQQDGGFLRRCKSQSGSFVSFEQRYSDRQNKNSCGVVGRPPHHKRFTPVNVRLPLNTGDEIKAKERRNQIRPREGNILQMPAQREKKSCAASCLNVFFVTGFLFQTQEGVICGSRTPQNRPGNPGLRNEIWSKFSESF